MIMEIFILIRTLYLKKTIVLNQKTGTVFRFFVSPGTVLKRTISRKEVFQPHLPVRLPCYDLALVTDLALGRSLR